MHVYLIGMPGAGKSTVGKVLAEKLGRTFVDLDAAIEKMAGLSIPEIFEKFGENYFREIENEALKTVSFSEEKLVIAQTYTVSSDNASVKATIAQGKFLTIGVSHESSGPTDPAFVGSMTFQLFEDLTPVTAAKIEQLVQLGFYLSPTTGNDPRTGQPYPHKNFHRVIPGFVVQGGSQTGNGAVVLNIGGYPFQDEYNQQLVYDGTGQLAMANAGNDTNDSQFFITLANTRNLDFNKTIFGQLVAGQDTLNKMAAVARTPSSNNGEGSMPVTPILFTSTTLSDTSPDGVVHIDTTQAVPGQIANLTVTARDPSGGTATRTVRVTVTPNVNAQGQPINEMPFLGPVSDQVVGSVDGKPQVSVFQLTATDAEPTDTLTYAVGSGVITDPANSNQRIINPTIPNATATVDANGIVRVTPNASFTSGVIKLLVGVRDQVNHDPTSGSTVNSITNFDTQAITLTVVNGAVVNLAPIALPGSTAVTTNTPTTVQLAAGDTANPQSTTQSLVFTIVTPPAHGTISNFDASKGTFTFTPAANFNGTDTVAFRVRDVGAPTPNLDSNTAVETLTIGGGQTNAVRLIGRVLVVTPEPRTDGGANVIAVSQSAGNIVVYVNGVPDATQPAQTNLDRIVVFGSKASDLIVVAPDVTVMTTLDGGHGGTNQVVAGAPSRLHGWFGQNTLKGGPYDDVLIGRKGRVRFKASGGNDIAYAGEVRPRRGVKGIKFAGVPESVTTKRNQGSPPRGTFYRFVNDRLVPTRPPKFPVATKTVTDPKATATTTSGSDTSQVTG